MAWSSAATILNDAAVELGLIAANIADPWAATVSDPNIIQLRTMLKTLGQGYVRDYNWTHLQKTHSFTTVDGLADYDLPSDFGRWVDQTFWNQSTTGPVVGPTSQQEWALVQASGGGSVYQLFRRQMPTNTEGFKLYPTPSSVETLALEYGSAWWCGSTTPDAEAPTSGASNVFLDRLLLIAGLQRRWKQAKGFDYAAEAQTEREALARALNHTDAAPVLSLNPGSDEHLIDEHNAPTTGIGLDGGGLG